MANISVREVIYRLDFSPHGGGSQEPAAYMARTPFQSVHVGDVLRADIWPDTYEARIGSAPIATVISRNVQVRDDRIYDVVIVESERL